MSAPTRPADFVIAAAESIRSLNHVTLAGAGYEWPSDVDAVIAALQTLTDRLPQALEQANRWLSNAAAQGTVGHDANADAVNSVSTADILFAATRQDLTRLSADLRRLREITSRLTGSGW